MPAIEITDEQHDRITALREELADNHTTRYTSVTGLDVVAYLLDLADTVEDPNREADITTEDETATDTDSALPVDSTQTAAIDSFPRKQLETRLSERNLRYSESAPETPMDLYAIAAEYDISGRSNMSKQELITAICDVVERRYTDPFDPVDIDFSDLAPDSMSTPQKEQNRDDSAVDDTIEATDTDTEAEANTGADTEAEANTDTADEGDDSQLNAMLNLLDTHSDKWWSADGDARYAVELPDGTAESARTKDDVRATLFKHY